MKSGVEPFSAEPHGRKPSGDIKRHYRQCANCGAPIEVAPIRPFSELGGALWSDGYVEADNAVEPPVLGKCRVCDAMGCLVELPVIEEVSELAIKGDYTFVPLAIDDYSSLLENIEDVAEQFHVYLRLRFWQLNNHRRRGSVDVAPLSERERANLVALHALLGNDDADRLIKAEICRELEEFEAAEALLAGPVAPEFTVMAERLRPLVADRRTGVEKIFSGEPGDEIPAFHIP